MGDVIISARELHKRYKLGKKEVYALRGVDLSIERGDLVALAGTSGSGKTTLLNIIGCLDEPTAGKITLFGNELFKSDDKSLSLLRRKKIGFIFQNFNLIPVLTAAENVEYALIDEAISAGERRQRALDALKRVGLAERATHRPDELSGGQRQRVAIARAIVHKPELIVADEPTASLDKKMAIEVLEILQGVRSGDGITVVMASHDPIVLERVRRVVQLSDGNIISDKTGGLT